MSLTCRLIHDPAGCIMLYPSVQCINSIVTYWRCSVNAKVGKKFVIVPRWKDLPSAMRCTRSLCPDHCELRLQLWGGHVRQKWREDGEGRKIRQIRQDSPRTFSTSGSTSRSHEAQTIGVMDSWTHGPMDHYTYDHIGIELCRTKKNKPLQQIFLRIVDIVAQHCAQHVPSMTCMTLPAFARIAVWIVARLARWLSCYHAESQGSYEGIVGDADGGADTRLHQITSGYIRLHQVKRLNILKHIETYYWNLSPPSWTVNLSVPACHWDWQSWDARN